MAVCVTFPSYRLVCFHETPCMFHFVADTWLYKNKSGRDFPLAIILSLLYATMSSMSYRTILIVIESLRVNL